LNQSLLDWWADNKRDFEWRQSVDQYQALIAESLLRRTNAASVEPVYVDFIRRFPSAEALAQALPSEIGETLKPLGLTWRVENLRELAKHFEVDPSIPNEVAALENLPGVGHYIARAVLVNTKSLKSVPVDSNILRVLCRLVGIRPNDNLRRNRAFQAFADSFLADSNTRVRETNYALLDLAALVCRPSNPKCSECPLLDMCKYGYNRGDLTGE
jgi:A/G-specific adenine glycosylase